MGEIEELEEEARQLAERARAAAPPADVDATNQLWQQYQKLQVHTPYLPFIIELWHHEIVLIPLACNLVWFWPLVGMH